MSNYKSLKDFRAGYYFFEPDEYGKVFVFIDFGNVRAWAKELWKEENKYQINVEIDIEKLAKICDLVNPIKKYFYYGYFPEKEKLDKNHPLNIKHRKSIYRINKAKKNGCKIVSKEIKMISIYDEKGKFIKRIPKCNFDVEITMDMIQKMSKYDSIMLFSGDSDFQKIIKYLKNNGKKIIVVCTRNSISEELDKLRDKLIPAESLKDLLRYENNKHSA